MSGYFMLGHSVGSFLQQKEESPEGHTSHIFNLTSKNFSNHASAGLEVPPSHVGAFSVPAHGGAISGAMADWIIFCWAFSFAGTLLVLVVQLMGLHSRTPVSWIDFPITFACYASLLCLSASIIFPLYFLKGQTVHSEVRDHRIASTIYSCLATVAYYTEVRLKLAQPGEDGGYMTTVSGLLKVCENSVASVILVLVSDPISYDSHPAVKWCMAVYCICFAMSAFIVVMFNAGCIGCLPFMRFFSAYALLAVTMYLSATIIWPIFKFDSHYSGSSSRPTDCQYSQGLCLWDKLVAVAVFTALNFLIYLADLVYTVRMVFIRD